jgi:hypothetical protein
MNDGEPEFLTRAEVEYLHAESLRRFGGSTGTREPGLVDSALGAAMNTWHCGRGDVFDVAASDAFHLAEAQAYLDGNKRTAAMAALVFSAQERTSNRNRRWQNLRSDDRRGSQANGQAHANQTPP